MGIYSDEPHVKILSYFKVIYILLGLTHSCMNGVHKKMQRAFPYLK